MSDSTLHKKPSEVKPETQFKTENIGKWASKQEDPFAAQNRKAAAKKQRDAEQSKKAAPIVAIILGVAASLAAIAGLVILIVFITQPTMISEVTQEESTKIQEEAQKIFNNHTQKIDLDNVDNLTDDERKKIQEGVEAVNQYFQQQANRAKNEKVVTQLVMEEMNVYLLNKQYQAAIDVAERIKDAEMTNSQAILYNTMVGDAYYFLNREAEANEYYDRMRELWGDDYVEG